MTTARTAPSISVHRVTVRRTAYVSPHLVRVTLGSDELASYVDNGADQRVKLLLPQPGQARPELPREAGLLTALRAMPADVAPIVRTYTLRRVRPTDRELDIDFVLHGGSGPAAAWAAHARPGDEVALTQSKAEYAPPANAAAVLLVGDQTALPAIGAIVEAAGRSVPITAVVLVADARDEQALEYSDAVRITWVHGADDGGAERLFDVLDDLDLPAASYAWLAAESDLVRRVRRYLITDRDVATERIEFAGYWKRGAVIEDEHRRED